ncbi:hypothetical protein [Alicyclobacillus vulcanalis]|uniref:Uncharacterized protein n=1 Tax=Alicyclobacillus vulcanalis TaxID=252246 RepID=A0A1N7MSJ2_9BACL|nr:hypothetical protein [Alicyclobacillus vulcanalis]SIS89020.1 hypothetical protein SAMN05421799_10674 [Alicyclobacillus vulcanalis]
MSAPEAELETLRAEVHRLQERLAMLEAGRVSYRASAELRSYIEEQLKTAGILASEHTRTRHMQVSAVTECVKVALGIRRLTDLGAWNLDEAKEVASEVINLIARHRSGSKS